MQECLNKFKLEYEYIDFFRSCSRIKVKFICEKHGERIQTLDSHLKNGCYCCYKSIDTEEFIKRAISIHGHKYIYDKVEYINSKSKVIIGCKEHGYFEQVANIHLNGSGCKSCSFIYDLSGFIQKSNIIHKNKYDYSKSIYIGNKNKIDIICPFHGIFKQIPNSHLSGKGCIKCQYLKISNIKSDNYDTFVQKANLVHNNTYHYNKVIYKNSQSKVTITCKLHGNFDQRPDNHLNKEYGCPKCGLNNISKKEKEWLDLLNIDLRYRQFKIDKFRVDGYDPISNTIYEFYGDFWHGNPKKYNRDDVNPINNQNYGELYRKTIEREDSLKKLGFNIVSIWENDYKL